MNWRLSFVILILGFATDVHAKNPCPGLYAKLAQFKESSVSKMIAESANFSVKELDDLAAKGKVIFESNASDGEKIKSVAMLYFNARIAKLPDRKQAGVRKALSNVRKADKSYHKSGRIFVDRKLDPASIDYQETLAHELEHRIQFVSDENRKSLIDILRRSLQKKPFLIESYGTERYRHELEAIGTQYDIIRLFPPEQVRAEAAQLKELDVSRTESGKYLAGYHGRRRLEAALEMSREEYISAMRNIHGYHGLWAAEQDVEFIRTQGLGIVAMLSIVGADAMYTQATENSESLETPTTPSPSPSPSP